MKTIQVQDKNYGWFSQEPITVTRVEQDEIVWCNHANIEDDEVINHVPNPQGHDMEWTDRITVCLKCGAWRLDNDNEWRNAPFDGVHYE